MSETIYEKVKKTMTNEGLTSVAKKSVSYIKTARIKRKRGFNCEMVDVLFINGCDESVPHPIRYRVTHQREQLEANNITTDQVFYTQAKVDMVRNARTIVIFRCPYIDSIGEIVKQAHKMNKKVIYDIDDLVVDTKYTDTIKYLDDMSKEERELYDDGVTRMGKTLKLCDAAITTTKRLATELSNYVPEVYINRNTASEDMLFYSKKALKTKHKDDEKVRIGYFSGSFTHNDDFIMIMNDLIKLMNKYPNIELHVVGELDLPKELEKFRSRIVSHPFSKWKELPKLIASVDINLAPLEESIFNEAKSENKWVEAALVKVPTVASNVGAFKEMIEDGVTGVLCNEDEWFDKLEKLVNNLDLRKKIAQNAYDFCIDNCSTIKNGYGVADFIRKITTPNYCFVLPSLNISGGIMVALKHACMLQDKGYDVSLLNYQADQGWHETNGHQFPVISISSTMVNSKLDNAIATMWNTTEFIENYANIGKAFYLVQNYEPDFYEEGSPLRSRATKSYSSKKDIQYITISKWCQKWLKEKFGKESPYASNGISTKDFYPEKREFSGKIRILVEGDCEVYYKNVDESFKIINKLDPEKYEVWYMSYNEKPKSWYRVDKFLHKVPYNEVPDVYRNCDILIKTSILESFSYPPLEMMSTGGFCVVVPNDGNAEYLRDEENCLLYNAGDIDSGVEAIKRICEDASLREKLYKNGIKTAIEHDWESLRESILDLYNA